VTPFVGITVGGVLLLIGVGIAGLFTGWLIRVTFIDKRRK
jgi:hypothetical protein